MRQKRTRWVLSALACAGLGAPAGAAEVPVQSAVAALAQDGREYAAMFSVPLPVAMQRLRAQEESVPAVEAIAAEFADRLTGISVEHEPDYRILVLLTGDAAEPPRTIMAGGLAVGVEFRTGAAATRARLVEAIRTHQAAIRASVRRPPAMGLDPRTGELVVMVNGSDAARLADGALVAEWTALTKVPVRAQALGTETSDLVEGGARVEGIDPANGRRYACTTGFVVTDGSRDAIVTAAHCPDILAGIGPGRERTPLDFAGQWGWGYQDVQLHVSAEPLRPIFFADTAKSAARPVTSWRRRDSTRAGDFVCHRGERTGYSCATVELVDFAPAGDLCGGACLPTWVTVSGPTCRNGDSGAPVFSGTTAFGIVKGGTYRADGSCAFYFYMSTDYLPQGWWLLHAGQRGRGELSASPTAGPRRGRSS